MGQTATGMPRALRIAVRVACPDWRRTVPGAVDLCRRAARATLAAAGVPGAVEASILLTDDATVRGLNARYRHIDKPTNVLSFPQQGEVPSVPVAGGAGLLLGDVVVAYGTVCAEAERDAKPIADHLCHMIVHGMLHLLGYDHQHDAEAEHMECLETDILASLGIASPYADRPQETVGPLNPGHERRTT